MSVYPPPTRKTSIFNSTDFGITISSEVTQAYVESNYLKKAGGQTVLNTETFQGGILTNSIGPWSGTTVSVNDDLYVAGAISTPDNVVSSGTVQGGILSALTSSSLQDATATSLQVSGVVNVTGNVVTTQAVTQKAPNAVIYKCTGQAIASSTLTSVVWDSVQKTSGSGINVTSNIGFNNNTGDGRWFMMQYSIDWPVNSTNGREAFINVGTTAGNVPNGAYVGHSLYSGTGGGLATSQTGSAVFYLAAGGGATVRVYQTSGSSLSIQGYVMFTML